MPLLSIQQARLQDDLRGLITGDVRCDEIITQLYATDAGMFECSPAGVVWPRSTQDVVAVVRYAAERGMPVHSRGAGTGAVGGAIGPGIILDFTRYMRRLLSAGEDYAIVYPGAVRERLNILLRQTKQHFFAPSAGHFPTCTIGSILATDCIGPRWLRYGFPHDHVRELEIVTPDGEVHVLRPETFDEDENGLPVPHRSNPDVPALLENRDGLWWKLAQLLRENREIIEQEQSDKKPECSGYRLEGVLKKGLFDPARLIVGSEGTLGIITRATVSTSPVSGASGAMIFLFDGLEKAARSIAPILESGPTLCDMLDRRIINMVCDWDRRFAPIFPSDTEVAIVVELDAETAPELNDRMNQLVYRIRQQEQLSFGSWLACRQVERELFRDLLRKSKGALMRIRHPLQIITLLEDIQIPVEIAGTFLHTLQNILKKSGVTYSISGHLGQGQLRILPILDPSTPEYPGFIQKLTDEVFREVFAVGGTVGSAQGVGIARSQTISARYPKLAPLFVQIKDLFDPENIFNPDKIVTRHLRNAADATAWPVPFRSFSLPSEPESQRANDHQPALKSQMELQMKWEPDLVKDATFQCTGCGLCRLRTAETRMCPAFRNLPSEDCSCRSKANLLRGILDGTLSLETLTDDQALQTADSCLFCHCCRSECPAGADIPELVFRIKSAWNASHGLGFREQILTHIDTWLNLACRFSGFIRCAFVQRSFRWLTRKLLTFPTRQKLPDLIKFHPFSPMSLKKKYSRPTHQWEKKVALFLDTNATYFDAKLLEAAIKVLEHNRIDIFIPPRQRSSGHESFVFGNSDQAEVYARQNVLALTEAVRLRYPIVTLEPVSAVCIKKEYAYVRNDEETATIADNTTDICSWLYQLHQEGKLQLDFEPLRKTVGYHAPCRTIALTGESVVVATPAQELLYLIPGLNVQRLERGCCGLGGTIGMIKENYKRSLKLSTPLALALRDSAIEIGVTECCACKVQMEQRSDKPVLHPLKVLALAYGLMTESELDIK